MAFPRLYPLIELQITYKFCQLSNFAKNVKIFEEKSFFGKVDSFLFFLGQLEQNFVAFDR